MDVRLMELVDLADGRQPPHACYDMLNAISTAELREVRPASARRIELAASVKIWLGFPYHLIDSSRSLIACSVVGS
jgi:hypothetical protein